MGEFRVAQPIANMLSVLAGMQYVCIVCLLYTISHTPLPVPGLSLIVRTFRQLQNINGIASASSVQFVINFTKFTQGFFVA